MNDRADIYWAPRVNLQKIRLIYINEARGLIDDELIDEVGSSLYSRCDSILEYTNANNGHVKCMRCTKAGIITIIDRQTKIPTELIRCTICGWQIKWRVYVTEASKAQGQLIAGHAIEAFKKYIQNYPKCGTRKDKLIAIDQLIHEFHWQILSEGKQPEATRVVGINLLEGTTTQILNLLNELAETENQIPEINSTTAWWRSQKVVTKNKGQSMS